MVRKLSVKHPAAFLRYMRNLRMEQTEREKKEQAYITQLKKNMNPEDVADREKLFSDRCGIWIFGGAARLSVEKWLPD